MVVAVSSRVLQRLLNIHVAMYQLLEPFLKRALENQSQMNLVKL